MKQYLITGYDYTDAQALERRMNVREHHLEGAHKLKDSGNYVVGGAILDDSGIMIGSMMVLQFETEEELNAWRENEIYIRAKVWEHIDIRPFRVAPV
jgi:uncharacterized protein YciI